MRSNKTETRQGHILRHQQRQKNYEDHEGETPDAFNYQQKEEREEPFREEIFSSICSSENEKRKNIRKNKSPRKDYVSDKSRIDDDFVKHDTAEKESPTNISLDAPTRGPKPQLSKEVNALNELINSISQDKTICYTQFYQFVDTLKQLTEIKRLYKPDESDTSFVSQIQNTKTNDFLWFLLNPEKNDSI